MGAESATLWFIPARKDADDITKFLASRADATASHSPLAETCFVLRGPDYWIDCIVLTKPIESAGCVSIRLALCNPAPADAVLLDLVYGLLARFGGYVRDAANGAGLAGDGVPPDAPGVQDLINSRRATFRSYAGDFTAPISADDFAQLHRHNREP